MIYHSVAARVSLLKIIQAGVMIGSKGVSTAEWSGSNEDTELISSGGEDRDFFHWVWRNESLEEIKTMKEG